MSEMISIVIPCYNEQDSIPPLMATLHLLREQMQKEHPTITIEVIVVEDGSTDDSYSMLKNYDFVNVLKNSQNIGYGASLKKGFAQAGGEWVCFFDMDLTYPIELLPRMWKKLIADDLDLVNGRRSFVAPGMSFFRGIGNWSFTCLTRLILRTDLQDVCSGFRVFHRRCVPDFLQLEENSLGFSLAMSMCSKKHGHRVVDFPISYHQRRGESKLNVWSDGWHFLLLILKTAMSNFRQSLTLRSEKSVGVSMASRNKIKRGSSL